MNLASNAESKATADWNSWSSGAVFAGQVIKDNSTHCAGSGPCTQVALNSGTTGASQPTNWAANVGGTTKDGKTNPVTWLNMGNPSTYGTPGLSLAGDEDTLNPASIPGPMGEHGIAYSRTLSPYPTCSNKQWNDGDYVLNPDYPTHNHLFRAVGSAMSAACPTTMNTATAGQQIRDSGSTNLYWQEVGTDTNYIVPVGYLVLVRKDGTTQGQETVQDTQQCTTPIQVGSLRVCKAGTTFVLTSYTGAGGGTCPMNQPPCGNHAPKIDSTHPLIVLGERPNSFSTSLSTFMARAQDLTADANNIAGEACLYVYGQEQSGCYGVNAISGTEASIAAIGPGSQNSMLYDFVATNPGNTGVPYQEQRLAGVYIDSRDGPAMKTVFHGTITPYNNPPGNPIPAGLEYVGKDDITIESVHTENVTDGIYCHGDADSGTNAVCNILSTDPAGGSSNLDTNTVHLARNRSAFVNTVKGGSTGYALVDENVPTGNYTQDGLYVLGSIYGSVRNRIYPYASPQSLEGSLFLAGYDGTSTTAGAIGLGQGADVSTTWSTNVVSVEAPTSVGSYTLTLPGAVASGVLQGSNNPTVLPQVTTLSFSGDSHHRMDATGQTGSITPAPICPTTPPGTCEVPGLYRVSGYIISSNFCTMAGTPTVGVVMSWTDASSSKSSAPVPLITDTGTLATTIPLGTLGARYGYFNVVIWSTGAAPIQIGTTKTGSCTSGTAKYDVHATVEQLG